MASPTITNRDQLQAYLQNLSEFSQDLGAEYLSFRIKEINRLFDPTCESLSAGERLAFDLSLVCAVVHLQQLANLSGDLASQVKTALVSLEVLTKSNRG